MTFEWARALVGAAQERIAWIGDDHGDPYEQAILAKSVNASFMIAVKEAVEHLRSALDYSAFQVVLAVSGPAPAALERVYYPIARKGANRTDFRKLFERQMPGVLTRKPTLFDVISSLIEFQDPSAWWLPSLAIVFQQNETRRSPSKPGAGLS